MTMHRLFWLLPLLTLQVACTPLLTRYDNSQSQIDQWVEEREYGRALKALSSVDPKDPHYMEAAEKRKQVEVLAANYEHEIRKENQLRLEQGNWAAALDSYDEALDHLPDSVVLKDGLAKLHREQANELDRLKLQRVMDHGIWLRKTLPTYQDIARVDPRSRKAQQRLETMQGEAESVADELLVYGKRALANHELKKARQLLTLAADLSDAPTIEESLKQVRAQQSRETRAAKSAEEKRRRQQQAEAQRRERSVTALLAKFDSALEEREYLQAKEHLQSLQKLKLKGKRFLSRQQQLEQALDKQASKLFQVGVSAYSQGRYAEAAKQWRQVLQLKPDHAPAIENLERAERVLEKLEQLKEKQHKGR